MTGNNQSAVLDGPAPTETLDSFVGLYEVTAKYGLHARPAAVIVKKFGSFEGKGLIRNIGMPDNTPVGLKSIMSLLAIEGNRGAQLEVSYEGSDASEVRQFLETSTLGESLHEFIPYVNSEGTEVKTFFRPLYE